MLYESRFELGAQINSLSQAKWRDWLFCGVFVSLLSQGLRLNLAKQPLLAFHTDPRVAGLRFMGKQTNRLVGSLCNFETCLTVALSVSLPQPPSHVFSSQPYPQLASLLIQTYLTVLTKTFWVYYQSRSATVSAL